MGVSVNEQHENNDYLTVFLYFYNDVVGQLHPLQGLDHSSRCSVISTVRLPHRHQMTSLENIREAISEEEEKT